ncbi:MAG TPA: hypothetical protein VMF61_00035 [Candidatus Acidoferrales bacterium]|nr:hypothetical protein [Candidatus Acidoferrales bacterium]
MSTGRVWFVVAALIAAAFAIAKPHPSVAAVNSTVNVKWNTEAIVTMTLTPNYYTGFGQVPAKIGTQPAPTHGPNAVAGGGSVDFGDVLAGTNYLYKYAVQLNVSSTDSNGVNLYGEGAADFFNQTNSTTIPISSAVYWLTSTSGTPADTNTGFSAAVPFQKTAGMVSGGSFSVPATIAYTVYPSPIQSTAGGNANFYFDYQLHVPPTAAQGDYFVWIVYTAIGK